MPLLPLSPLLSLLLLLDASDDVVHVPARGLLLEAGDHGVDVLVVAPSPPELIRICRSKRIYNYEYIIYPSYPKSTS